MVIFLAETQPATLTQALKKLSRNGFILVPGSEFWLQEGCDNGAEQRVSARIQDLVGYLASIQLQD